MTAVPRRRREEVIEAVETEEGRDCDNPNYHRPDDRTQVGDEARGVACSGIWHWSKNKMAGESLK